MLLFEVRHQGQAQFMLQRALAYNRIPHAYVFHGPDGVGKEMLAVRFCRLLLCARPRAAADPPEEYANLELRWQDACAACHSCELVLADTHPDCHLVHRHLIRFHPDAGLRKRKGFELGIDVIRHFVIEPAHKTAVLGGAKVFIIREAHKLNARAQNALLKTLEEPPANTYIILLSRSRETLLPTLLSRCQQVPFALLPDAFVADVLGRLLPDTDPAQIEYFSHHEPGSIGRALHLIADGFYNPRTEIEGHLMKLKPGMALDLSRKLEDQAVQLGKAIKDRMKTPALGGSGAGERETGESDPDMTDSEATRLALNHLLAIMATMYRDILHECCGHAQIPRDHGFGDLAQRLGADRARRAIQALAESEGQLNRNAYTKLCLDSLALRLSRLHAD